MNSLNTLNKSYKYSQIIDQLSEENQILKNLLKRAIEDCKSPMQTIGPVARIEIESILDSI